MLWLFLAVGTGSAQSRLGGRSAARRNPRFGVSFYSTARGGSGGAKIRRALAHLVTCQPSPEMRVTPADKHLAPTCHCMPGVWTSERGGPYTVPAERVISWFRALHDRRVGDMRDTHD